MANEITIPLDSQAFDLAFHPTETLVFTGLLTGEVQAYSYDDVGKYSRRFSLKPSKKSCRSICLSSDASRLFSVGKGKAIHAIDLSTEKVGWSRFKAHRSSINRVATLTATTIATGDDDGGISIWDTREDRTAALRTYSHHFDHITDFLWFEEQKQLVATSGDGSLSVMDVRAKKEKFVQSEDQEDELLSMTPIDGGSKMVVGTQSGVLSLWDRRKGWGDCVDRVTGHPSSVDAICTVPSVVPFFDPQRTIITGSSDGLVRVAQVLPTKLHGVLADHGDWPVERIAVASCFGSETTLDEEDSDANSTVVGKAERPEVEFGTKYWVGSIGHDESLRLSDLSAFHKTLQASATSHGLDEEVDCEGQTVHEDDSDSERSPTPEIVENTKQKRRRKGDKDPMGAKRARQDDTTPGFFDDL